MYNRKTDISLIPRIVCECGWYNNQPSKAREDFARCKKCGRLLSDKARFKATMYKMLKGENEDVLPKNR